MLDFAPNGSNWYLYKVGSLKGDKATAYREFRDRVDAEWIAFQHESGKPPNAEQKKQIVNSLLTRKVFVEEWGRDPEKPIVTLSAEEAQNAYVPIDKVPAQARAELINIARANGLVSPDIKDEQATRLLRTKIEKAWARLVRSISSTKTAI